MSILMRLRVTALLAVVVAALTAGCLSPSGNEVVVYTALDRQFSDPVLKQIERELDFQIRTKFDQESNKTVGLANELIQSAARPPADVFWNNEILQTIRLEKQGLLETLESNNLNRFPRRFRSATGAWCGFAARARVLIVNTNLIPADELGPRSILDLAEAKWVGQCAIAKPVFGTTATHAAVILDTLGPEQGKELLQQIAANAEVLGGNRQVAKAVAAGHFAFGLTDTDDAVIQVRRGEPVAIVFPDQDTNQMGTLLIPNTLGVIKNGPNTQRAHQLVDRLLAADIEQALATGPSAQCPLATDAQGRWTVESRWLKRSTGQANVQALKVMAVDFSSAETAWQTHKHWLKTLK